MNIKQFLKPNRIKLILFVVLFVLIFFGLPFIEMSTGETNSLFWLVKNYSGSKLELSMIVYGFIIYFVASYFVSCSLVIITSNFKIKK